MKKQAGFMKLATFAEKNLKQRSNRQEFGRENLPPLIHMLPLMIHGKTQTGTIFQANWKNSLAVVAIDGTNENFSI